MSYRNQADAPDYNTREDFAWYGLEQLSEAPDGCEMECPICYAPLE